MRADLHRGALAELREPWEALHAAQPSATPFTAFGWALRWETHFGDGADPFSVVVYEGEEVVGLAALVRRRRGPLRVLEPVGMEPGD
ncbi:MAG: hypothetical protein WKF94_01030 [Solirubrobacteraceae bacterium]